MVTEGGSSQEVARAEKLLRQAVVWSSDNQGAHRGLGWVLAAQGENAEAGTEWLTGGFTAQDFIARGEQVRKAKQYEEALAWFERAAEMEPELGDPWYYIGLTYERMEWWEQALEAYERAVEARAFAAVGRSSPYYKRGGIYQWGLDPRQTDAALVTYEAAIEIGDFSDDLEAANCHYQRGEILRWTGRDPDEYIIEYQQAINLNPNHASAHVYLGVAYYIRDRDAVRAEIEIQKALMLEPKNQWACYHLGEIYRQEGRVDEAIVMYRQALEIAPDFEIALERLQSLVDDN